MRRLLLLLFIFLPQAIHAQTLTPNLGLQIPSYQQTNWQVPINYNFNLLDLTIAGTANLPAGQNPGVSNAPNWITSNLTASIVLNNIQPSYNGQRIALVCGPGDTFTQIVSNAHFVMAGAWSCSSSPQTMLILTNFNSVWYESGRSGGSPISGFASGDLAGSYPAPTVIRVNNANIPVNATIIGTNGSGQLVNASGATLSNNISGSAQYANLQGFPPPCTTGNFVTNIQTGQCNNPTLQQGPVPFSLIASGTNVGADLVLGSGARIDVSTGGVNVANFTNAGGPGCIYTMSDGSFQTAYNPCIVAIYVAASDLLNATEATYAGTSASSVTLNKVAVAPHAWYGNNTGGAGNPGFQTITAQDLQFSASSTCGTGYFAIGIGSNFQMNCQSFANQGLTVPHVNHGTGSSCTTGTGAGSQCSFTVNFVTAEPDNAYDSVCTGVGPFGSPFILGVTAKSTAGVTILLSNGEGNQAVASGFSQGVDCIVAR